jgi:hypothetical protein
MSRQSPRGIKPQLNRFFAASNTQPNDPDIPNPFQKGLPEDGPDGDTSKLTFIGSEGALDHATRASARDGHRLFVLATSEHHTTGH